mgnify:CR=1 FL=1
MTDILITCGDSFACGSGLDDTDAFERSYAGLTAKKLGIPQKVLARPGCCNFIIWLQIKYAVHNIAQNQNPFVLITMTNAARASWYKPGASKKAGIDPSIEFLNYIDYPPYDTHTRKQRRREIPVETDNSLQSETLQNLDSFFDSSIKATWPQMEHEPNARLKVLKDWVADFFNFEIKQEYDNAILLNAHCLLKQAGIPHVFMGWQPDLQSLLPEENYVGVDWGWWSQRYPDPQGTGHCDEQGHKHVFNQIKPTVEVQCK